MQPTMFWLVDRDGTAYVKDDAESYTEVAAAYGLDERACHAFRFDLTTRQLRHDGATGSSAAAVQARLADCVGTPKQLMTYAAQGHVSKQTLASLLSFETRKPYLQACARIEERYTAACTAKNDPCLASGCSLEGEVCLEPVLNAGIEYRRACAAEWIKLFESPGNRIDAWKN